MHIFKRVVGAVLCAVLLVSVFAGCGEEKEEVITQNAKPSFSIPGTMSGELNPFFAKDAGDLAVLSLVVETFVSSDGVATLSEEQTEDGMLKVTVSISKDIKCSDNTGLFAIDFMYAVQLVCDPTYDGPYTELAESSLVGLGDFKSGNSKTIAGLTQVDNHTCTVLFSDPDENYQTLLDLPAVRTHNYDGYQYGLSAKDDITYKYVPVIATGILCIDSQIPNSGKLINLKRNDHYHNQKAKSKNFSIRYVRDEDVGLNISLGQLTYGFLSDKTLAKEQAEKYGYTAIMLADGALLGKDYAPNLISIGMDSTIHEVLGLLAASI